MKLTYAQAREEFQCLDEYKKKIYNYLSSSNPIDHLLHDDCYDDLNVIINFNLCPKAEREYFEFDVAYPLEPSTNPYVMYNVKGSILRTENIESILYTINSPKDAKDNIIYGIYLDNKTFIKEGVSLKEIFKFENSSKKIIEVILSIDEYPNQDETFVIDPRSQIYRLYSKGKIDIVSLCNFVLYQSKENKDTQTITDNRISLTKKLSKNFLSKRKNIKS